MLKKIMVVDNSKAILRFMTDLLEGQGYEVRTALDGLAALELLNDFVPELMFIDLVMPKIGGDKLCRILRKRPELDQTFLVILSAIAAERHFNSLDYCADACIAKGPAAEIEKHILAVLAQRERGENKPIPREVLGASEGYKREVVAELLGSKDHFEITLEHMAEGFLEFTPEKKIIFANPAASSLFQIPEEKLLALDFVELFSPEYRHLITATVARLSTEPLAIGEESPLSINGRQVRINFLPVVDLEQRYIIAIIHDITDRRLAEEAVQRQHKYLEELVQARTADLLESNRKLHHEIEERVEIEERLRHTQVSLEKAQQLAKMGNWEWDLESQAVSWSEQMYRIFQVDIEQCGGNYEAFLALVHGDDRAAVDATRRRAVESGKPYSLDYRILLGDGRELTLHEQAEIVRGGTGAAIRIFGTTQDVTERKRLESQLLHSRKMEAIGQLAAGIAHEVNTPTQYIGDNLHFCQEVFADLIPLQDKFKQLLPFLQGIPAAQLLKSEIEKTMAEIELDYLQKEIPLALAQAAEGNKRVAEIVMAMKEFAHPGSKEKTAIDLNHAIETTLLVARNAWKYVTGLETDFDPSLPLVPCLPSEFNQVILNIVVNAAQAIGELMKPPSSFKGVISIRTRKAGEWAEIVVKDNGPGMVEAVRNRIFTPFFTTKKVGQGTGQGLAIAYAIIVDKHQGTIEVESKPGAGTTFTIRLPLAEGS